MKRTFLLLLALTLIAASAPATAQVSAPAKASIVFKIPHVEAEESAIHQNALKFEKYVEQKTGGKVDVQVYPNGQLGGDKEILEAIQLGTVQMSILGTPLLSSFNPKFDVLDLPYLFDDYATMNAALVNGGPLGKLYITWMEGFGFRGFGFEYDGARSISNNVRPINSVADMKGLKIRSMQSPMYLSMFRAMGANPTPMSFTELYTALSQGVVDGQDNPPGIVYTSKLYEVQKYYSLNRHTFGNSIIVAQSKYIDGLPADVRQVIIDGAKIMQDDQRKTESASENDFAKKINDSKTCKVNEIPKKNMQGFRDAMKPIYDAFRKTVGDATMNQILKAAGRS